MMHSKDSKAMVRLPDSDIDFLAIVFGVLQGDAFAPSLYTIGQDYELRNSIDLMKESDLTLKGWRYQAEI